MSTNRDARQKRGAEVLESEWGRIKRSASRHARDVQRSASGDRPWEERTVRDVFALKVLEMAGSERRAKVASSAGHQINGLIFMQARMDNPREWERFAAAEAAAAIEAVAADEAAGGTGDDRGQ